jgi:hypothetical protein
MCLEKIEQRLDLTAWLKDAMKLFWKSGQFAIIAGLF